MCVRVCVCVKMDKLNIYKGITGNISFFIYRERNITSKHVANV